LTASHNPPEYNGYKVYWKDGGQIVPPHDGGIIAEVNQLDFEEIKFNANPDLLEYIGEKVDDAFTDASVASGSLALSNRDDLTIVFTSLHGTSITAMPQTLEKAGYKNVHIVEEQREPNGDFPTVTSPNPEEPAALKMATELAEKVQADIVIGTDPDSDRLGIAVRDLNGNIQLLNRNQTMVVMTDFLIKKWKEEGKLNGKQFVGTTIVSTEMVSRIANNYGVDSKICLTGFKWIAKMIIDYPELEFIGGGEESFGYMVGDFVRDKDAITASLLACEIATYAKSQGSSFYEELLKLYTEHGFYKEHLISITKKGMDGAAQIKQMMIDLRTSPITEIDGEKVKYAFDYESSVRKNLLTGEETAIDLPKSNVLIFLTENGTRIAARPSGTEPKIKFYFSTNTPLDKIENAAATENILDRKIKRIIKELSL
jgi:phosphoglucomutase